MMLGSIGQTENNSAQKITLEDIQRKHNSIEKELMYHRIALAVLLALIIFKK